MLRRRTMGSPIRLRGRAVGSTVGLRGTIGARIEWRLGLWRWHIIPRVELRLWLRRSPVRSSIRRQLWYGTRGWGSRWRLVVMTMRAI